MRRCLVERSWRRNGAIGLAFILVMAGAWITRPRPVRARQGDSLPERVESLEKRATSLENELVQVRKVAERQHQELESVKKELTTANNQLNKITNGWFLIQSSLQGRSQSYLLDVAGGQADGGQVINVFGGWGPQQARPPYPLIQLVGGDVAQPNRKWRLILLP